MQGVRRERGQVLVLRLQSVVNHKHDRHGTGTVDGENGVLKRTM